ncbi:hypothetical protein IAQ61_001431 [Plenodomus lingam]|uniref:uncharacterized protein n=1 Tax=Leptosphaeria maculans TaxID=5022 RepID=UPI00332E7F4F|nr:hypothetical protein IAQ61_001431 [Plenodomus lingam]
MGFKTRTLLRKLELLYKSHHIIKAVLHRQLKGRPPANVDIASAQHWKKTQLLLLPPTVVQVIHYHQNLHHRNRTRSFQCRRNIQPSFVLPKVPAYPKTASTKAVLCERGNTDWYDATPVCQGYRKCSYTNDATHARIPSNQGKNIIPSAILPPLCDSPGEPCSPISDPFSSHIRNLETMLDEIENFLLHLNSSQHLNKASIPIKLGHYGIIAMDMRHQAQTLNFNEMRESFDADVSGEVFAEHFLTAGFCFLCALVSIFGIVQ